MFKDSPVRLITNKLDISTLITPPNLKRNRDSSIKGTKDKLKVCSTCNQFGHATKANQLCPNYDGKNKNKKKNNSTPNTA